MITILTTSTNGKIELTAKELKDLLAQAFDEGRLVEKTKDMVKVNQDNNVFTTLLDFKPEKVTRNPDTSFSCLKQEVRGL